MNVIWELLGSEVESLIELTGATLRISRGVIP